MVGGGDGVGTANSLTDFGNGLPIVGNQITTPEEGVETIAGGFKMKGCIRFK